MDGSYQRIGELGEGELFSEYRVSHLQDEKVFGDLLHNNVNILNTTDLLKS